MWKHEEAKRLSNIFAMEGSKFEEIYSVFSQYFDKTTQRLLLNYFNIAFNLNLFSFTQRLIVLYILYEYFKNDNFRTQSINSLIALSLNIKIDNLLQGEKLLLSELDKSNSDVKKLKVRDFQQENSNPGIAPKDSLQVNNQLAGKEIQTNFPNLIIDSSDIEISHQLEMFFASLEHEQIYEGGYSPNFLRPIPRVEDDINDDEIIWLNPSIILEPSWVPNAYYHTLINEQLKELAIKSFKTALADEENTMLISNMRKSPNLINLLGFYPNNLNEILKNNSGLVYEIIAIQVNQGELLDKFLDFIENLDVSYSSINLIGMLKSGLDLPMEVIFSYLIKFLYLIRNLKNLNTLTEHTNNRKLAFFFLFLEKIIFKDMDSPSFQVVMRNAEVIDEILKLCKENPSNEKSQNILNLIKTKRQGVN